MLHTEKSKPFRQEVLSVGLMFLRIVGLWGTDSRKWYRLMVIWFVIITLPPKMILGSGKDTFESFARNVTEVIFTCENCAWIVIFAYRRESFQLLVETLECFLNRDWSSELRVQIETFIGQMHKLAKYYAVYIGVMSLFFISIPIVSTVVKLCYYTKAERGEFFLVTETNFYGLDTRRDLVPYVIFTILGTVGGSCCGFTVLLKGVIAQVAIRYGAKLFEIVSKRINAMEQMAEPDQRKRELLEIIELHNLALKYLRHLEFTISISLLNITLSCLFMWCLLMFYLSKDAGGPNGVCVLILFIVTLVEMTIYSVNGTNLQNKAYEVANAIYQYPWHRESIGMQQAVRFIIQKAQRPAGITAGKFHYIDLQQLGSMIQASYSYYLILKDRF
ncbi:odorant receptor 63a-like [Sabethes cyaneus]|uniref:odorant receptor 63a-like n=1 Tax=Sabethes cyaneus TaxID=53552 RepID=UPI00237E3F10|nr:odorant receptor 63a-like [Sabethes cyaneus]